MTKKKKNETQPQEIKVRDAVFHPEFREDLAYWVKTNRKLAAIALIFFKLDITIKVLPRRN